MNKGFITKVAAITMAFVLLAVAGYFLSKDTPTEIYVVSTGEPPEVQKIIVTVTGEAKNGGKYSVPIGSSVHDVLYRAGGVTDSADLSVLNLDSRLFEDTEIHVPQKVYVLQSDIQNELTSKSGGLCNINTAKADELVALPGIGEGLARDIVNYREVNGSFEKIEDIMNVSGIGEKKFEQIKDKITVGG